MGAPGKCDDLPAVQLEIGPRAGKHGEMQKLCIRFVLLPRVFNRAEEARHRVIINKRDDLSHWSLPDAMMFAWCSASVIAVSDERLLFLPDTPERTRYS